MLQHAEDFVGAAFDNAREPVTVAGGGIATRGPWAGHANAARNEEASRPAYFKTTI